MSIANIQLKASNKEATSYELLIYGDIGESFWSESVSAKSVVDQLQKCKNAKDITIRINSFGGSVADGLAIYNSLKQHPAKKTVCVDGVACSAGSLIAMAGDVIKMPKTSMMMIHAPHCMVQGNASELRSQAELLDKFATSMIDAYTRGGKVPLDTARQLLSDGEDHWYTGEEACANCFADEVLNTQTESDNATMQTRNPIKGLAGALAMASYQMAMVKASKEPKEVHMDENLGQAAADPLDEVEVTVDDVVETEVAAESEPESATEPEAKIDINAAIEAAVSARLAEANAKLAELEKANAEVQAKLAGEIEAHEIKATIEEAKSVYAFIPGVDDSFGMSLRKLRKVDSASALRIEQALKGANALLATTQNSQTAPVGQVVNETNMQTVEERIESLARAKMSANKNLTAEQARSAVYSENPQLVRELRGEV